MSRTDRVELLNGTLDLIVLRALATMGPLHAYALASRLEQVAEHPLMLNQGTLYPALVRLEQRGWIKGSWRKTESNREAKYYAITRLAVARSKSKPSAGAVCPAWSTSCCSTSLNPRGFAPRHASAEASAMSAVALAKAELPYTRSRAPLRRRAPIAWLARMARSHLGVSVRFMRLLVVERATPCADLSNAC